MSKRKNYAKSLLEPGNYVKWKSPSGDYRWSQIVDRYEGRAVVAINGSGFEIEPDKVSTARRACAYCGKPVGEIQYIFCSQECATVERREFVDRCIFDALVAYKRAHDGLSPKQEYLVKKTGYVKETVRASLRRLAAAGKVYFVGTGLYRQIAVVGGKWTYEP